MEREMTTFKKILFLFFTILIGSFITFGVIGLLNHNSFQSIVINTLKTTGFCTVIYGVGMTVIWVALRIVKIIPNKNQKITFNK